MYNFGLTHLGRQAFSSGRKTIFVAAGSPTHDLKAANFMRALNAKTNNAYRFIGIGGTHMKEEGLQSSYADVSKFLDKPFFPLKNFLRFHIARCYHPYMAVTHYANKQVLNQVDKSTLLDDVVLHDVPSAFITFGNEFFMKKLYVRLQEHYERHNVLRPPTFFYDRSHINQRFEFQEYLDHFLYTIPRAQINFQNFTYPSTCVGHEGVGRAIQFLFKNSAQYPQAAALTTSSSIQIANDHVQHRHIVEKLVEEQRAIARKRFNIGESKNVFVLAPGNTKAEINFAVDLFSKSMKEFFGKAELTNISQESFAVIVVADSPENQAHVEAALSKAKHLQGMQTVTTVGDNDKFAAICAGDVGVPTNGEVVSEFAALQLPSVIIDKMTVFTAYVGQLYNNFYSDLNFSIAGEAQHELVSTAANPLKLSDELFDLYADPKLKFYISERYSNAVHSMIPSLESQVSTSTTDLATLNDVKVQNRSFTYETISQKVLKAAQAYEAQGNKSATSKADEARRNNLIRTAL